MTGNEAPAEASSLYTGRAVAFFLGGQRYALPIDRVQEIQQIVAFAEVPGAGSSVVGMVNLRGRVIPVVDLRRLLAMTVQDFTLDTPMIICRIREQLVALVADEVQDVIELPGGCLQDPPAMHALASKMLGVARMDDGLIYLLDIDQLLGETLTAGGW
jgi:purine-binding chemotaxis protein CheW